MKKFKVSAFDAEVYQALSDPVVFADLFNGSVFRGEQVLRPDMLQPANEKEQLLAENRIGGPAVLYRIRDLSKNGVYPEGLLRVVLSVEGQKEVHYGMPVRVLLYDAISYAQEVKKLAAQNREKRLLNPGAEFLSGLAKGDRIAPVFTVVFYYGEEQDWDGPVRIHEMLDFPEEIEPWIPCIPDYKINLVSSRTVDKENFQTGLREVFELLGVMGDREKLERLLEEEKTHYSSLDAERAGLVASFLDIPILKQTDKQRVKGRKVDMCTAIQEMVSVGKAEGKAEALLEFLEGMGTIPAELRSRILAERDTAVLGCWLRKAARIKNIEEFVLK